MIVTVPPNGIVSPTMPVSYMTHASALAPVPSCLLSPLIHNALSQPPLLIPALWVSR